MRSHVLKQILAIAALLALVAVPAANAGALYMLADALVATAKTAPPLPTDASQVTRNALGGLGRESGWCEQVGAASENLWASSHVPSELDNQVRSLIRYVKLTHIGNGTNTNDDSTPVCTRLGPDTDSPALSCNLSTPTANGDVILSKGAFKVTQVRPITTESSAANSVVPLWAMTTSGVVSNVTVCVLVGW
jgi:hypothetical protein